MKVVFGCEGHAGLYTCTFIGMLENFKNMKNQIFFIWE